MYASYVFEIKKISMKNQKTAHQYVDVQLLKGINDINISQSDQCVNDINNIHFKWINKLHIERVKYYVA